MANRTVATLTIPVAMTPDQFFEVWRARTSAAERDLMCAVMQQAIDDLRHEQQSIRAEALAWLEDAQRFDLYSLNNICDVLGFSAVAIRDLLLHQ